MNITKTISALSTAYDEKNWLNFVNSFKEIPVQSEILDAIPRDIRRVLINLLGLKESEEWIIKKLKALDNNSVLDLISSEVGIKAVKMYIITMPN